MRTVIIPRAYKMAVTPSYIIEKKLTKEKVIISCIGSEVCFEIHRCSDDAFTKLQGLRFITLTSTEIDDVIEALTKTKADSNMIIGEEWLQFKEDIFQVEKDHDIQWRNPSWKSINDAWRVSLIIYAYLPARSKLTVQALHRRLDPVYK